MSSRRNVVLIDDETMAMKYYTMALNLVGFDVTEIESADAAWEYFAQPRPDICAVVLDIMLPPGKYLENEDHHEGLRTGGFLYRRIVEQECIHHEQGVHLPIAVLTNVSNAETLFWLQMLAMERKRGQTFRVWQKLDTSAMQFADQFARWLRELGR